MAPRQPTKPVRTNTSPEPTHGPSQDRERHLEDARHHPQDNPLPHPPHQPHKAPALPPRHHPHTRPPEEALNIDHGTHQDRPRPGKIAKKGDKKSSRP
ncbi:MAG: hypothetical protein LUQ69_02920 [Methanoregulaceae archaeon]|nr:hypothetical protein [Methanoregulaceae archaeon]